MVDIQIHHTDWQSLDSFYTGEFHLIPHGFIDGYQFVFTEDNLMWHNPSLDALSDPEFPRVFAEATRLHGMFRELCGLVNLKHSLFADERGVYRHRQTVEEVIADLSAIEYPANQAYLDYKKWKWVLTDVEFAKPGEKRFVEALYKHSHPNPGYVYLISIPSGPRKIGRAMVTQTRLKAFDTDYPEEPTLEHRIFCRDYVVAERTLHIRYADKRIRRTEWFWLTPEDIEEIKAIKEM